MHAWNASGALWCVKVTPRVDPLAGGGLGVNSSIAQPAVSVGAPGEQLTAGGGHRCVVLGHRYHCNLPSAQACDCSGDNDGTLPTMDMEVRVTCVQSQCHCIDPVRADPCQQHGQ